jgi:hypothetical protein
MKFRIIVFVFCVSLFLSFAARSQAPPAPVKPGSIKSIKLDQNVLTLPCPRGSEQCDCFPSSNNFLVNVQLEVLKPDKRISYRFAVTAGKIIGEGTNVVWDLRSIPPGSYTIRAQVIRKGATLADTKAETLNIFSNIISCDCFNCPVIEINATGGPVPAGDNVSVSATVNPQSQDNPLTLNWTTTVGEITSGQGTSAILIKVPAETKTNKLVVTLTVGGLRSPCSSCPASQSATINLKLAS